MLYIDYKNTQNFKNNYEINNKVFLFKGSMSFLYIGRIFFSIIFIYAFFLADYDFERCEAVILRRIMCPHKSAIHFVLENVIVFMLPVLTALVFLGGTKLMPVGETGSAKDG